MPHPLHDPSLLLPDAPRVRDALTAAGWSSAALEDLLGAGAQEHLDRRELAPLRRRTAVSGALPVLARLLVLGEAVPREQALTAGVPASWLVGGSDVTCPVRLQAVLHDGVEVVVPHDPPAHGAATDRAAVLGVGAASLTLAAATPRARVGRVLDVGCGSGVQALLAAPHADHVVATDRNPRAVDLTRLAAALAGSASVEAREGSLLEPAAGEAFDLVVSNPPFVVGPQARFTYRDAGLAADEVCRSLVAGLPDVMAPGGHAVLLASWLHLAGEDGDERVLDWLRGTGCDGWVVQREVAAPEDYVTAWLRDSDDEGPAFDAAYETWVDWCERERVEAVAFGVLALRRRTGSAPPLVRFDDVPQQTAAVWGEELLASFGRHDALAGDVLDLRLRLRDDVRLVQVGRVGEDGWEAVSQRLQQEAGLRWSGGIDEVGATVVAGCDGSTQVRALVELLAPALEEPVEDVVDQVRPVVAALVSQGFLTPA